MKNIIKKSAYSALTFFGTLIVLSVAYAAYQTITSTEYAPWATLTSSLMTKIVGNVDDLNTRMNGITTSTGQIRPEVLPFKKGQIVGSGSVSLNDATTNSSTSYYHVEQLQANKSLIPSSVHWGIDNSEVGIMATSCGYSVSDYLNRTICWDRTSRDCTNVPVWESCKLGWVISRSGANYTVISFEPIITWWTSWNSASTNCASYSLWWVSGWSIPTMTQWDTFWATEVVKVYGQIQFMVISWWCSWNLSRNCFNTSGGQNYFPISPSFDVSTGRFGSIVFNGSVYSNYNNGSNGINTIAAYNTQYACIRSF